MPSCGGWQLWQRCSVVRVDGLGSIRWVRLARVHDVDWQLLAVALVRLANAHRQAAYGHERDARFACWEALGGSGLLSSLSG